MGRHSMVEEPAPRPSDGRVRTGQQRAIGSTTTGRQPAVGHSTGQHPAVTSTGQRPAVTSTGQQRAITSTGQQRAITSTGQRPAVTSTEQQRAITSTGQQRAVGYATGHHRAIGKTASRRRIAKWPLVVVAVIALLAVGLFGWKWASNVVNNRAEAQANSCAEGDSTMRIVVAPDAAGAVSAAATKWNNARTVVHAHCVHIDVQAIPSDRVFDALTGHADLSTIGGLPAAWIPEATDWANRLATDRPDLVAAPAEPLTAKYTLVYLSGPDPDEVAARAAQVFRDFLLDPAQRAALDGAGPA